MSIIGDAQQYERIQAHCAIASIWRNASLIVCVLLLVALRYMAPVWLAPPVGFAFALSATLCMLCSGVTLSCRFRLWRIKRRWA